MFWVALYPVPVSIGAGTGIMCQLRISFLQSHLTPVKGSFLSTPVTSDTHSYPDHIQCRSPGAEMTFIAKTFYDLRATTLEGDSLDFNVFRGRVVLIENVASLWGTTIRDFSELNQLQSKYPHRLVVLGFPCNQFGYQVSAGNLISLEKELSIYLQFVNTFQVLRVFKN